MTLVVLERAFLCFQIPIVCTFPTPCGLLTADALRATVPTMIAMQNLRTVEQYGIMAFVQHNIPGYQYWPWFCICPAFQLVSNCEWPTFFKLHSQFILFQVSVQCPGP